MQSTLEWVERDFLCTPFHQIFKEMKQWIATSPPTAQLWFGEHPLIVTKGIRSQEEIVKHWPSIATNRGGELTMHLPGQLVFYPLWLVLEYTSIDRYRWILEEVVMRTITMLSANTIKTYRKPASPGVFTERGKIASLGLRLYRKSVYHGLSFNVSCPLAPFKTFISCGDPSLSITSLKDFGLFVSITQVKVLMKKNFYDLLAKETSLVLHDSSAR